MWKMVIGLCAAMYGLALLVGPAEKTDQASETPQTPEVVLAIIIKPVQRPELIRAAFTSEAPAPKTTDTQDIIETALDAPAKPKRPDVVLRDISFIAPMPAQALAPRVEITTPDVDETPEKRTVTITARSVNLRAGPSTGHGVLRSLKRGTQAVLVDDLGNGWSKIAVKGSTTRGYIASRFLSGT